MITSPHDRALPLRGVVFVRSWHSMAGRWAIGQGRSEATAVAPYIERIDYEADGDATFVIRDVAFTLSSIAATPTPPRTATMTRTDIGRCNSVDIVFDHPVAALRVHVTRAEGIDDQWLVEADGMRFSSQPICESLVGPTTLELFVVLADGREQRVFRPVDYAQIPIRAMDEVDVDGERVLDLATLCAWLFAIGALFVAGAARPRVAVHGLTLRGYLPKLRFRVRMPRARVVRR
jgi:hypothetical protein